MGELLSVVYGYELGESPVLPAWVGGGIQDEWAEGRRLVGEMSTIEVGKKLALT